MCCSFHSQFKVCLGIVLNFLNILNFFFLESEKDTGGVGDGGVSLAVWLCTLLTLGLS